MKSVKLKLTEGVKIMFSSNLWLFSSLAVNWLHLWWFLHQLVSCGNYDYGKIKLALTSIFASYKALEA